MKTGIIGAALAAVVLAGRTDAVDYHLDALKGSDAADGRSPATAWKSIAKVNATTLGKGDRVLLRGGQVHAGTISLTASAAGITITSFGGERAILDGGAGSAIDANGVTGLTVTDLELRGMGRKSGNDEGAGVKLIECRDAVVERVEAHGFQQAGVKVWNSDNIRIERVHAHDNGFAGIHANGRKITIRRSRAINNPGHPKILNNHSGNGILVSGADILVEYCEAAGNGWDQPKGGQGNGPVGIWCHDAQRVTIQYCIAHHNMSTSGDGGGFDFDGGTRDSVIQYCYSYQNYSSGFLIWEYGSGDHLARNTIRYSVSINDREGGIRMGKSGGKDVEDLDIHHNTIINFRDPCVNLQGSWEDGKFVETGGLKNVRIHDNIMIGPKDGEVIKGKGSVRFEGNCWWSADGKFRAQGIEGFDAWVKATGQETVKGKITGIFADPKLADMKLVPQLTDPEKLVDLFPFMLQPGSPAAGRGFDPGRLK